MVLRGRLDRLERSAKPILEDGRDPVVDEACRRLSTSELRLIRDVLRRELDGERLPPTFNVSTEERAAFDRFYELYEEVRRGA